MRLVIKSFLLVFLAIFSVVATILLVNFFLPKTWPDYNLAYIKYSVDDDKFNSKYIFWRKPYCEKNCKNPLEKIALSEIVSFGEEYGDCKKILFLGDSFTQQPWDGDGRSYAEHFAEKLSENDKSCYTVIRLGSPATNNDQQFAAFSDSIAKVKPSLVVWQFYWNDLFENLDKRLYVEDKNNSFKRISGLGNMYFWAGWIYQNIPLIRDTNIGFFLLYLGELKRDMFFDWNEAYKNQNIFFNTNNNKIKYFLSEVKNISEKNNSKFITTVAPMECELGFPKECDLLEKKLANFSEVQHSLVDILKNNSEFVSMYENESVSNENKLNNLDFRKDEEPGMSHLNASGLEKVGNILFLNFVSKY